MPAVASASGKAPTASYFPTVASSALQPDDGTEAVKRRIADFNRDGW